MLKKRLFGMMALIIGLMLVFSFAACKDKEEDEDKGPPEVAHYDTLTLVATVWNDANGSGESMNTSNQIKLSDFTTVKPQAGDVFKFKISGDADVQLEFCYIDIFQMQGDNWGTYRYLGGSERVELPKLFKDRVFETTIGHAPVSNLDFYVQVSNGLWQKNENGEYIHNSNQTLPPGTQNGDVVGTISDFSISLVVDSGGGNGGDSDNSGGDSGGPSKNPPEVDWERPPETWGPDGGDDGNSGGGGGETSKEDPNYP